MYHFLTICSLGLEVTTMLLLACFLLKEAIRFYEDKCSPIYSTFLTMKKPSTEFSTLVFYINCIILMLKLDLYKLKKNWHMTANDLYHFVV